MYPAGEVGIVVRAIRLGTTLDEVLFAYDLYVHGQRLLDESFFCTIGLLILYRYSSYCHHRGPLFASSVCVLLIGEQVYAQAYLG